MPTDTEPLLDWLKRQRRINEVQLELMALQFDLDGALDADEPELAWRTLGCLVVAGAELHLRTSGVDPTATSDHAERADRMLTALARFAPATTRELWAVLLGDLPQSPDALRHEIERALALVRDDLSVPAAASRAEAIREWAAGVKLLREVATGLGAAGSDSWYLPEDGVLPTNVSWYDQVIDLIGKQE